MASDYNADLIAELYATTDEEQATRISDEMVLIGDPIFPRQIYEAYKRFKNSTVSHYFISDLTRFKIPEAAEILKEIIQTTEKNADISMMVSFLTDIQFFDQGIIGKILGIFKEDITKRRITDYGIKQYVDYLQKSNYSEMWYIEELLIICFEDNNQDIHARKAAISSLLKLDAKKFLNRYYENYDSIKGKKSEIIFVQEISTWGGGMIPALHTKIKESGSPTAKEILQKEQDKIKSKKEEKDKKEQKEVKTIFETADVISEISALRSKINKISSNDEKFGFAFLLPTEEIYQQNKSANDKPTLVGYCMSLRPLLGAYNDKITNFEISDLRAKELIPDLQDPKGSINRFNLFLLEKGIEVDKDFFGLRNLNRIITKFAAHTNEETSQELIDFLQTERLYEDYKQDNWSKLHRGILEMYKNFLERLLLSINK